MSLILADDHTLFREVLTHYLARAVPDLHVLTTGSVDGVLDLLARDPDVQVALLDWRMPGMAGRETLCELIAAYPSCRFALMSGVIETQEVESLLELDLWGYFPKTLSGKMLVSGIVEILNGRRYVARLPGDGRLMASYGTDGYFYQAPRAENSSPSASLHEALTVREREVLQLLGRGMTNAEIGAALSIRDVTVKLHVRNLCRKLKVRNRTEAALRARTFTG